MNTKSLKHCLEKSGIIQPVNMFNVLESSHPQGEGLLIC